MKAIQISIDLRIPLAINALSEFNIKLIQAQAANYTALLCKGLDIPAEVTVKVENTVDPAAQWLGLQICGQVARVRYAQGMARTFQDFLPLGSGICEEICRNRILLATPEVLAYAATLAPEGFLGFSAADQQVIVSTLFDLGFGLNRLKQFSGAPEDQSNPRTFVENCIANLEASAAKLSGCAAEIEPDDNPYDYNRLVEALELATSEIFKQSGLPVPVIRPEVDHHLAPGHFCLRLNDLFLPVRALDGVQAQFVFLLNQLKEYGHFFINRGSVLFLLESLETFSPNLLAVFRAKFSTDTLVHVLRQLTKERISIRALVRILEIMVGGDDTYVVPHKKWFPTPISENIIFLAKEKSLSELDAADWSDFVRMYYKPGLRNLALNHGHPTNASMVRGAMALNLHDYFLKLAASEGAERAANLRDLHQQLAIMVHTDLEQHQPRWFCINAIASYRRELQEAIRFEFPEIAVFSNQELVLINLSPDESYTLSL